MTLVKKTKDANLHSYINKRNPWYWSCIIQNFTDLHCIYGNYNWHIPSKKLGNFRLVWRSFFVLCANVYLRLGGICLKSTLDGSIVSPTMTEMIEKGRTHPFRSTQQILLHELLFDTRHMQHYSEHVFLLTTSSRNTSGTILKTSRRLSTAQRRWFSMSIRVSRLTWDKTTDSAPLRTFSSSLSVGLALLAYWQND